MRVPTRQQCFHLMCEMKMMDHIVAHSIRVCQVTTLLVEHLNPPAADHLNKDLVRASALLHDVTKTRSFETGENHAETAADLLKDLGYPAVSRIIGQHVRLDGYAGEGALSEAEIVNYSDKRVLHDQVVSLAERFDYILERYGKAAEDRERIQRLRGKTAEVGDRIFSRLPFAPETLVQKLDPEIYARNLRDYHDLCDGSRIAAEG